MGEVIKGNFRKQDIDPEIARLYEVVKQQVKDTAKEATCPEWAIAGLVIARMVKLIYSELNEEAANNLIDIALQEWAISEA